MIKKINIPSYFDMGISFDGIHRYANNGTFYYMIQVKQKKKRGEQPLWFVDDAKSMQLFDHFTFDDIQHSGKS